MSEASERPHSRLCAAITEFDYYQKWIANSKNIITSAEDYIISCPRLGQCLREAGECVFGERADDFLCLCRRVLMEYMALNEHVFANESSSNDSGEDSSPDGASVWPSKCLLTSRARFNAQLCELRENMCEYELYAHWCAGCDDEIRRRRERHQQPCKSTRVQKLVRFTRVRV